MPSLMASKRRTRVNKPVDVKERQADVNRKLQLYGIIHAFKHGKVPSNDQIDVALNSFLESKPLSNPSKKLSEDGQTLVADVREVVRQAKYLLLSKNNGNLLQDFIWQTQQFDPTEVAVPEAPLDKERSRRHMNQALEGLRTLGTLIISNGQFRKLLKDASILLRDIAGDAAVNAATRVRPKTEDLAQLDEPAEDNTWYDVPGISKDGIKNKLHQFYNDKTKEKAKVATLESLPTTTSNVSLAPVSPMAPVLTEVKDSQESRGSRVEGAAGSSVVSRLEDAVEQQGNADTEQYAKAKMKEKKSEYRERMKKYLASKMPQERREQIVWRLKKMIIECQQHPDYQRAIQTLLDLSKEYGNHARRMAKGGSESLMDARAALYQAERDLKLLIERFANGTSTDDLWASIKTIYEDAEQDPELRYWFKAMNDYIRRCLQEQGYILDEDSNTEWDQLYEEGNYLLRDKYRGHTDRIVDEVKFLLSQFDEDPQIKAFAASLSKLFNDLGNDEKGKPTFKPRLVKDLTDVILPSIFEKVAYIPIPRIEYSDPHVDVVIENLVLESDNFMPNVLEISSENYLRYGRKTVTSRSRHSFEVKVSGIQMDLRDVSYYVKRKQGFPSMTDTGVANMLLAGDGLSFRIKLVSADEKDAQCFFKIEEVEVDVEHLRIELIKSNHKLLFNIFKPLMLKLLKPGVQRALEKTIKDQATRLDKLLFEIKQEADRALEQAREDPRHVPNFYKRYMTAAQKRILQSKKKRRKILTDKKVNYAITQKDSIFPDVHLPGGISAKATEYKELALRGDSWESPIFSVGNAAKSRDIPPAPKVVRKPHAISKTAALSLRGGSPASPNQGVGTPQEDWLSASTASQNILSPSARAMSQREKFEGKSP